MVSKIKAVLVVCIDRDNDLGRKAKIKGPVLGRQANIKAAVKLGIADPSDSDTNSIFATIKKYDEIKSEYSNVEIVTFTGHSKLGFKSDKIINEQLDSILSIFPADAFVLVSDGAEDDQILPILQSRGKILSKETIFVKQAKEVESTFYTIKEAVKDPLVSKIVFGVPGIILLLIFALPSIGFQLVLGLLGGFLLLYGFGIIDKSIGTIQHVFSHITTQRNSFPFYIATFFIFIFGLISAYSVYNQTVDATLRIVESIYQIIFFYIIAFTVFNVGRVVDAIHLKKAFRLGNYLRSTVSAILIWFILDAGKQVFIGKADLTLFLVTIVLVSIIFYLSYQFSKIFDVRKKITKLLIGSPVYSLDGEWIGKVESVNRKKQLIEFRNLKTKKLLKLTSKEFLIDEDGIFLSKGL